MENANLMDLEYFTSVLLLGVFIAAEVYRAIASRKGFIVGFKVMDEPGQSLSFGTTAHVKLKNGDDVYANISPCTMCLGRLGIGEEVRVIPSGRGYLVDLPWFRTMSCSEQGCHSKPAGIHRGLSS